MVNDKKLVSEVLEKLLEKKHNVFISGRSGAGKTYLTRQIIDEFDQNNITYAIGGSTGIAARNIHPSGRTINSLLKLGIINNVEEYGIQRRKYDSAMANFISELDVLIIEEISMISASFFDVIIHHLNRYGFKGAILAIGDFYQLMPVVGRNNIFDPRYYLAFQSQHWLFHTIYLDRVMRTTDKRFIEFSNLLREGKLEELANYGAFLDFLEEHSKINMVSDDLDEGHFVKLFATNKEASVVNKKQLALINEEEVVYRGKFEKTLYYDSSTRPTEKALVDSLIVEEELTLKLGCRVMNLVNGVNKVNGDLGTVVDFHHSSEFSRKLPVVQLDSNGLSIIIEPHMFEFQEKINNEFQTIASFEQLPLKLAYAITVHKSQGLTIENLFIDCSKFFEIAQLYVSFTRASNPSSMIIENFNFNIQKNEMLELIKWFYDTAVPFQNDYLEKH